MITFKIYCAQEIYMFIKREFCTISFNLEQEVSTKIIKRRKPEHFAH